MPPPGPLEVLREEVVAARYAAAVVRSAAAEAAVPPSHLDCWTNSRLCLQEGAARRYAVGLNCGADNQTGIVAAVENLLYVQSRLAHARCG